jgi:lipopolysaccharide transport system permease protein
MQLIEKNSMQPRRPHRTLDRRALAYGWDLLRELVVREIKVRYQRSVLGLLWSLISPLLQILVFYFIFQIVLTQHIPRYASYVLGGLLAWNWFQTSLTQAASAITGNRDLIRQPGFPATVLPAVSVAANLIHFVLALPILFLFLWLEGGSPSAAIFWLPAVIALQFLLTLSLAYLVASLNVLFRDTQHLLVVFLQLAFFLTPIFYDASRMPADVLPAYRLNPLVRLVEAYRDILIAGVQPDWGALLFPAVLAVGLLCYSYRSFSQVKYRFVEEL